MSIDLSGLETSATALIRTVDALGAEELAAPSLLPGWTRAHVVAHLALNGTALAGVMDAVLREEPVAMYESDEQRDTDIEELARADRRTCWTGCSRPPPSSSTRPLAMDDTAWTGTFSRRRGPIRSRRPTSRWMRRHEIEIHHADLGAVYARQDWPQDFVLELLDVCASTRRRRGRSRRTPPTSSAPGRSAAPAAPRSPAQGPTSAGGSRGRGEGGGLSSDAGALPRLGPWRRASATAGPTPER